MKINPGARFGMAVPIAADVRLIPLRNKDWNRVTLHKIDSNVYHSFNYHSFDEISALVSKHVEIVQDHQCYRIVNILPTYIHITWIKIR